MNDLHLHIVDETLNDLDVRRVTVGAKDPFDIAFSHLSRGPDFGALMAKLRDTQDVWLGNCDWTKASFMTPIGEFVPEPLDYLRALIGSRRTIEEAWIPFVREAWEAKNASEYKIADVEHVVAFLEEHMGQDCFIVSWDGDSGGKDDA